jgi:hypothetical protein
LWRRLEIHFSPQSEEPPPLELAAGASTPALKEHLHDVAPQYDALAERVDEVARVGGNSP